MPCDPNHRAYPLNALSINGLPAIVVSHDTTLENHKKPIILIKNRKTWMIRVARMLRME
jgi:hypothetical protein